VKGLAAQKAGAPTAAAGESEAATAASVPDTAGGIAAVSDHNVAHGGDSSRSPGEAGVESTPMAVAAAAAVGGQAPAGTGSREDQQQCRRGRSPSPSSSTLALASPHVTAVGLSSTSCPASRTFWGCLQHELQCESCGHK
jgi:hypothetical protein